MCIFDVLTSLLFVFLLECPCLELSYVYIWRRCAWPCYACTCEFVRTCTWLLIGLLILMCIIEQVKWWQWRPWYGDIIETPDQRFYDYSMLCNVIGIMDARVWLGMVGTLKYPKNIGNVVGSRKVRPIHKHYQCTESISEPSPGMLLKRTRCGG